MTDGSLTKYCSPLQSPDGEVCKHGFGVFQYDHWSWCVTCLRVNRSTLIFPLLQMAFHLYSELRSTRCSCGEPTRETMACCAPGGTNCQHPGQWRETAVGTRVCAAGALPGHPDACAHKPDADMARSHWSCCADLNRASNKCLRQPTHAHTHPGDWRVSSAKRYTKHCSPTWEVEGRVCKHGAVIQASHWSWYVWIMWTVPRFHCILTRCMHY